MTEETQPSETPEVVEPSLDDVIEEFNSSYQPRQETVQPEPQQVSQQPSYDPQESQYTVDPLDQNQWNQYLNAQRNSQTVLQSQVQELSSKLTQYEQKEQQRLVEADIQKAVESVNKEVNADPLMVELYLEKTASTKPGFKSIWENRHDNPKAFEKALKAVSKELQGKFAVKQDPQLTENQRAISSSQQSMASKSNQGGNSIEDRLAGAKTQAEFDRIWAEARR